jgi:hypothetical protein
MNRKRKKSGLTSYQTTVILLSILVAVMSLVIFMPAKNDKPAGAIKIATNTK